MTVIDVRECRDVLLRLPDPAPSRRFGGQCDECGAWCAGLASLVDHYLSEHDARANSAPNNSGDRQVNAGATHDE